MIEFILFYLAIGLITNVAVIVPILFNKKLWNTYEIKWGLWVAFIPLWPYTLFRVIQALTTK